MPSDPTLLTDAQLAELCTLDPDLQEGKTQSRIAFAKRSLARLRKLNGVELYAYGWAQKKKLIAGDYPLTKPQVEAILHMIGSTHSHPVCGGFEDDADEYGYNYARMYAALLKIETSYWTPSHSTFALCGLGARKKALAILYYAEAGAVPALKKAYTIKGKVLGLTAKQAYEINHMLSDYDAAPDPHATSPLMRPVRMFSLNHEGYASELGNMVYEFKETDPELKPDPALFDDPEYTTAARGVALEVLWAIFYEAPDKLREALQNDFSGKHMNLLPLTDYQVARVYAMQHDWIENDPLYASSFYDLSPQVNPSSYSISEIALAKHLLAALADKKSDILVAKLGYETAPATNAVNGLPLLVKQKEAIITLWAKHLKPGPKETHPKMFPDDDHPNPVRLQDFENCSYCGAGIELLIHDDNPNTAYYARCVGCGVESSTHFDQWDVVRLWNHAHRAQKDWKENQAA